MKTIKATHRILAAVTLISLTGCAVLPRHTSTVEEDLSSIIGADISTAVGILGFPDAHEQMAGGTAYVWFSDRAARLPETEIRMGSYDSAQTSVSMPTDGACWVKLSADESGRISGYEWSGSRLRCGWVVEAFRRAAVAEQSP